MSKRKHNVTPNTEETDWLRENVPRRTLTRWKKRFVLRLFLNAGVINIVTVNVTVDCFLRKINKTLSDIEKHTAQRHVSAARFLSSLFRSLRYTFQ